MAAILRGFRRQLHADGDVCTIAAFDAGPSPDQDEWWDEHSLHDPAQDQYWDDLHGGWLDPKRVKDARAEELQWMQLRKVFTKVPEAWAKERKLKKLSLKWIDTCKADVVLY